jgi:hypothetical protein
MHDKHVVDFGVTSNSKVEKTRYKDDVHESMTIVITTTPYKRKQGVRCSRLSRLNLDVLVAMAPNKKR